MADARFDAVVVGAGPAGSVAAYVLAAGGARVALVDRVQFPRDKACGDLLSPRTIHVLEELGVKLEDTTRTGDMRLLGPTGRTISLPWPTNAVFPAWAVTVPRISFDDQLRRHALNAGAEFIAGDVEGIALDAAGGAVVTLGHGRTLRTSFAIGADGALSKVAESTGLSAPGGLWGFALRYYLAGAVREPYIIYWEPDRRSAFPGYGWVFPSTDGRVNVGLGMSTGSSRDGANLVNNSMPAFIEFLSREGLLESQQLDARQRRGGWLKMGLTGTTPARESVLLVGDAAGLVNPLAGEGISGAVCSARDAAQSILESPGRAAAAYREILLRRHGHFYPQTAALQSFMVSHPRMLSFTGRLLTGRGFGRALSRPWSMYWNDLVEGSSTDATLLGAKAIGAFAQLVTIQSALRKDALNHLASSNGDLRQDEPPELRPGRASDASVGDAAAR